MTQTQVSRSKAGFYEGGEVLDFAVAVLMVGVGGLVGDSDGEIGKQGRDQIESGVRGFGEDAKTPGGEADHDFSAGDEERGDHRVSRDRAFFGAHGVGRVEARRPGHDGIICDWAGLRQWESAFAQGDQKLLTAKAARTAAKFANRTQAGRATAAIDLYATMLSSSCLTS